MENQQITFTKYTVYIQFNGQKFSGLSEKLSFNPQFLG